MFILGDLFEVWVGDDALDESGSFEAECAAILRAASAQRPLFFMCGNRDFLVGAHFLASTGLQGLDDPTVLHWAGPRLLLSHGDALCLDDVDYQRFRSMVRAPAWQQQLLARPLAQRRALAQAMRSESEQRKHDGGVYADLDAEATARWMAAADAPWFIHGHTHRPADHGLSAAKNLAREMAPAQTTHTEPAAHWRLVLSDWHMQGGERRAEVLRVTPGGWQRLAPEAA